MLKIVIVTSTSNLILLQEGGGVKIGYKDLKTIRLDTEKNSEACKK